MSSYEELKLCLSPILEKLSPYQPVLIGTFPIGIEVPGSDVDIACEVYNFSQFKEHLLRNFPDISVKEGSNYITGSFSFSGFDFEIYGERKAVSQQNGYLHMKVEEYFLLKYGEEFRQKVLFLKRNGMKTEPAFAKLLGLEGDPYEALLVLAERFFP